MLKKFLLGAASSMLLAGAANAETILVNDGPDFDGAGAIGTSPAPEFSTPGFFGGTVGNTDVSAFDNSVAHRFNTAGMGNITGAILTIVVNEFLGGAGGAGNDRILAGFANAGGGVNTALTNLGNPQALAGGGNTITLDLGALGFLGGINANGFFDVLVTDDTNVDFFSLALVSDVPLPAALPLMASALVGGSIAARRRKAKKA